MSQETTIATTTSSSVAVAPNRVEKSRQNFSFGRNVVDDVVAKLPDWLRRSLDSIDDDAHNNNNKTSTFRPWIDRLREDYRVLEARTHVGSLGKFDKPQARVVAILSCRWANVVVSSTVSQHVAAAASTKTMRGRPKHAQDDHVKARQALAIAGATTMQSLDQLCVQVDDLLRPLQQTSASTHAVVQKNQNATSFYRHDAATLSSTKHATEASSPTSMTNNNNKSAIIPDLAIQFGNWIPDAQGVAHNAQQLMTQVEQFISTSVSSHLRTGYAYELQKHRSAYEAACFYIHAKQQDGTTTTTTTTTMTKKLARKRKRFGGEFEDMDDDGNDNDDDNMGVSRQLELGHVLKALSSFSCTGYVDLKILKGVVAFLTKLMVKMKEDPIKADSNVAAGEPRQQQQQAKLSMPSNRKRNLNTSANCKRIKKGLMHADASHEVARLVNLGRRSDKDHMTPSTRMSGSDDDEPVVDASKQVAMPLLPPKPNFLEWKEKVLADAKRNAKEALGKEDATELELLMHAANDVLRRHGVLPLL